MKNKKILLLFFFFLLSILFIGCDKNAIDKIEIDSASVPEEILLEDFDLTEISIIVTMADGKTQTIALTETMLSDADLTLLSTPGTHTVTVNYMDYTAQFTVTIIENELKLQLMNLYQLAVDSGTVTMTYEEWLDSIKGEDGKQVAFQVSGGWIQWQYTGDTEWKNLVDLSVVAGEDGAEGRSPKLRVHEGKIEWQYEGDTAWTELVLLSTLTGADGKEVSLRLQEGFIQWQHEGDTDWVNLIEIASLAIDGADGKAISLQLANGYIQWQYEGDTTWENLIDIASLTGAAGKDGTDGTDGVNGKQVVLQLANGYIQWQYEGETTWKNLIEIASLTGGAGKDGVDGREVVLRVEGAFIQWQYEGDTTWENLIEISTVAGKDGLSAYQIYLLYHLDYNKSEEEWLDDLVNGRLGDIEYVTVTFDLQDGTMPEGCETIIAVKKGSTIDLPLPTKTDCEFLGWATGFSVVDGMFSRVTPVDRNLTLYAVWDDLSDQAKVTYYSLDEIHVTKIEFGVIFDDKGHVYFPEHHIINKETEEEVLLYVDFTQLLMLENEETIETAIYSSEESGLVFKTSLGRYVGFFENNDYGQYGLGHNDPLSEFGSSLFSEIALEEGENLSFFEIYPTYNVAYTDHNRVFVTGTILFEDEILLEAFSPLDITDEFALQEGEYFVPNDDRIDLMATRNEIVTTNLRSFTLAKPFEMLFGEQPSLYFDLSLILQEEDEYLFTFCSSIGFLFLVSKFGHVEVASLNDMEELGTFALDFELNDGEEITDIEMNFGLFTTNQGRFFGLGGESGPEQIDLTDSFPALDGYLVKVLAFENGFLFLTADGRYFIAEEVSDSEESFVLTEITNQIESLGVGTFYHAELNENYFLCMENATGVYQLRTDGFEPFIVPVLSSYEKRYELNTEITLDEYPDDKYAILGWQYNGNLVEGTLLVEGDITLYLSFASWIWVHVESEYGLSDFPMIQGTPLSEEEILEKMDIPYGYQLAQILNEDESLFDFTEKQYESFAIEAVFEYSEGNLVGITYMDELGNIVDYQEVLVQTGDALNHPDIEVYIPSIYTLDGYYCDIETTIPYDPALIVTGNITIYAKVTEKPLRFITLDMPEGYTDIVLEGHQGVGFDEAEIRPILDEILNSDVTYEGAYFDPLYNERFVYDGGNEDLMLYIRLVKSYMITLHFYVNSIELPEYRQVYEFTDAKALGYYVIAPNGYIFCAMYYDSALSLQVTLSSYPTDALTDLHIALTEKATTPVEVVFDNPELNFIYEKYTGNTSELYDAVRNYLITNCHYYSGYSLYKNLEHTEYIYNGESLTISTVYVFLVLPVYKLTVEFPDTPLATLVLFYQQGEHINSYNVESTLNRMDFNWYYRNLELFLDLALASPFESGTLESDMVLFASFDTSAADILFLHLPNGRILEYKQEDDSEVNLNDLEYFLDYYDAIPSNHYIEVYYDAAFGTGYNKELIMEDTDLYVKLVPYEILSVTVNFPGTEITAYTFEMFEGSYFDSYVVRSYLESLLPNTLIDVALYTDPEMTVGYINENLSEDLILYANIHIIELIKITVYFPFDSLDSFVFRIPRGEVFTEEILLNQCNKESWDYKIVSAAMYRNPEMTILYEELPLFEDTVLFVQAEKRAYYDLTIFFPMLAVEEFSMRVLEGSSLDLVFLENVITNYLRDFGIFDTVSLQGLYFDSTFSQSYSGELIEGNLDVFADIVLTPMIHIIVQLVDDYYGPVEFHHDMKSGFPIDINGLVDFVKLNHIENLIDLDLYYDYSCTNPYYDEPIYGDSTLYAKAVLEPTSFVTIYFPGYDYVYYTTVGTLTFFNIEDVILEFSTNFPGLDIDYIELYWEQEFVNMYYDPVLKSMELYAKVVLYELIEIYVDFDDESISDYVYQMTSNQPFYTSNIFDYINNSYPLLEFSGLQCFLDPEHTMVYEEWVLPESTTIYVKMDYER